MLRTALDEGRLAEMAGELDEARGKAPMSSYDQGQTHK